MPATSALTLLAAARRTLVPREGWWYSDMQAVGSLTCFFPCVGLQQQRGRQSQLAAQQIKRLLGIMSSERCLASCPVVRACDLAR